MAEYIKKSDLEKHIIREGCDEGCGYIDERDLKDIPTYEVYGTEEVIAMLTELQMEIEETVKEEELIDKTWANGLHYSEKIIQQKINTLKGENETC